ncbi:TrkH family potassium uptake protein [Stomatohabitans albus]|uniref:TrkH family potassium uptake protein n=1 Tax=Stomatohabitans albus TaxID=3110766 RepID=UPI00300D3E9D
MKRRLPLLAGLLIGWSSAVTSTSLAIASALEFLTHGPHGVPLVISTFIMVAVAALGIYGCAAPAHIHRRHVYTAVTITWIVITLLGAIPYVLTGVISNPLQAWFESTSGFTTVGSSTLSGEYLDHIGYGVGFWRASTQWIGGIGVVVLAVMALPVLGVGGLELVGAEAPGPTTDKFTPRANTNAWRLAGVYLTLTVCCALFLYSRGLTPFEAVTSSFTTVATGGFSVKSTSFATFSNDPILLIGLTFFMAFGATDMGVFWRAWRGQWPSIWVHGELRAYLGWIAVACAIVAGANAFAGVADPINSIFTTVSFLTTTGFASVSWDDWPAISLFILLVTMFTGGMTGSTTGGLKILRCQISWQVMKNELMLEQREHQIVAVRIGPGQARIPRNVVRSVLAFHIAFIVLWLFSVVGTTMYGFDPWTSIAAVTCSMSTIGITLGGLSHGDWSVLPPGAQFIHIIDMLAGRLEILPMAVTIRTLAEWIRYRSMGWNTSYFADA